MVSTARLLSGDLPTQGLRLMRLTDDGWGDADRDPSALVGAAVEQGVTLDLERLDAISAGTG